MIDSQQLKAFTLLNASGLEVKISNFGGKIMSIIVPDRNGTYADIVLGYDRPDQYISGNPYLGALIGRFGNRIANGRFSINGIEYQLTINNGAHSLHGGPNGFHNKVWDSEQFDNNKLALRLISPDGEENFPGKLSVSVFYLLNDSNELVIQYEASSDKTTIINLTSHGFFNLAGKGDVLNHELKINADRFIPVDNGLIPTGEIRTVTNSPFDFMEFNTVGARINENDEQLRVARGYDHTFVLNKKENEFSYAAAVREPNTGRVMEVWTTEPGLQFYSGNFLDGKDQGKNGNTHSFRSALCLEAQHFPDSPNQPEFPSTLLSPGETYKQKTVYKFGVD